MSDAINSLIEKNIIYAIKENNLWTVDLDKLETDEEHFFKVYNNDMNKIFEKGDLDLFKYYCIIMNHINETRISITILGEDYNLGRKTILRYNKILEDINILNIDHGNYLKCNVYRNCNEINERGKAWNSNITSQYQKST